MFSFISNAITTFYNYGWLLLLKVLCFIFVVIPIKFVIAPIYASFVYYIYFLKEFLLFNGGLIPGISTLVISFNTFLQEIFLLVGLVSSSVIDTYFSDTNSKSFEISLGLVVAIYLMSRLRTGYNFLKTHD